MTTLDLNQIKDVLLKQRQEIVARLHSLEEGWNDLGEREIEREEEAQKADLTSLYDKLDAREIEEIKEIDSALFKIDTSGYGICQQCQKPISVARLEVLPATPWCKSCAETKKM